MVEYDGRLRPFTGSEMDDIRYDMEFNQFFGSQMGDRGDWGRGRGLGTSWI